MSNRESVGSVPLTVAGLELYIDADLDIGYVENSRPEAQVVDLSVWPEVDIDRIEIDNRPLRKIVEDAVIDWWHNNR